MTSYRYDDLTWPEVKEAAAAGKVILVPIGSIEDHGPHLPLNTDNVIVESVCFEVARRVPAQVLSLPVLPVGFEEHHMDVPGSLTSSIENLLTHFADAAISVARHGFTHIMLVNGHGSNASIVELAARKAVLATGAIVAAMAGNAAVDDVLVRDLIAQHRRSAYGGIGHACEYETSMMLYLRPDLVQMDKAVKEMGQLDLKYFNWDHPTPAVYSWMDWWSRFSQTGVAGDPTVATRELGELLFNATVERMIDLLGEFRQIPLRPRHDLH
ncbi:MAG: creatininase family protein [Anaerolineae bacterium]